MHVILPRLPLSPIFYPVGGFGPLVNTNYLLSSGVTLLPKTSSQSVYGFSHKPTIHQRYAHRHTYTTHRINRTVTVG